MDGGEAEETYFTQMTVGWHLEDGRYIRRTYQIPLSTVMDAYEALYDDPAYKEGLYYILKRQPSDYAQALYREAGRLRLRTEDAGDIAVSYTHLDVYKRQPYSRQDKFLPD